MMMMIMTLSRERNSNINNINSNRNNNSSTIILIAMITSTIVVKSNPYGIYNNIDRSRLSFSMSLTPLTLLRCFFPITKFSRSLFRQSAK